jgi:hypothetical protein
MINSWRRLRVTEEEVLVLHGSVQICPVCRSVPVLYTIDCGGKSEYYYGCEKHCNPDNPGVIYGACADTVDEAARLWNEFAEKIFRRVLGNYESGLSHGFHGNFGFPLKAVPGRLVYRHSGDDACVVPMDKALVYPGSINPPQDIVVREMTWRDDEGWKRVQADCLKASFGSEPKSCLFLTYEFTNGYKNCVGCPLSVGNPRPCAFAHWYPPIDPFTNKPFLSLELWLKKRRHASCRRDKCVHPDFNSAQRRVMIWLRDHGLSKSMRSLGEKLCNFFRVE